MTVKDAVVTVALIGIAYFGYKQSQKSTARVAAEDAARDTRRKAAAASRADPNVTEIVIQGSTTPPPSDPSGARPEPRDEADIRARLNEGATGTYIRDILAQQDQMLLRWPEKRLDELRVWIEPTSTVQNWNPKYPLVAEHVFSEWQEAGFPIRFVLLRDSAGAAIQIRWVTKLVEGGRQIGITRKTRDRYGWISRAEIDIATFDGLGHALTAETVAGVARHEVGHALGLGHSPSTTDVMYPESTTPVISGVDRATLHLLYTLPPGVVK